ncbi:MAG: DUF547 domain-containing protein [Pseudomonadota bacterium]
MSALRKVGALFVLLALLPGFGSGERLFAPGLDLWDRWTKHDASSSATIDHGAWTGLLKKHVSTRGDGVNLVAYQNFAGADKAQLKTYLDDLASTRISAFNRAEQMAYWINLYNALTVQVVLDHFPVASIRDIDISPGLIAIGPWDKKLITVEGEELSLNDIEHRILRPIWKDPRIHYVVNCASIGCPNLAKTAYTGAGLERALQSAATAYVNDPRGVSIRNGQITVSRIYDWFIEDFGGDQTGILRHLSQYADAGLKAELGRIGTLTDTEYDWSVNAAR